MLWYPLRWKKVFSDTLRRAGLDPSLSCLTRSWGRWATTAGVGAALSQHGGDGLGENSNWRVKDLAGLLCPLKSLSLVPLKSLPLDPLTSLPVPVVRRGRKGRFEIEYNHLPFEAKQSSPVVHLLCCWERRDFPPCLGYPWASHCSSILWKDHSPFPVSRVP